MKHNKKRNTAFIYEMLVRELTKAIVHKDLGKKEKVVSIIKEYFSAKNILIKELRLYRALLETKNVQQVIADRLLIETKRAHAQLDGKEIFDAQSKIIAAINKTLGQDAWSSFVPNFKSLASVNAVFNPRASVKHRVLFEQSIIDNMSAKVSLSETKKLDPLDNITYNSFIGKFNNKYDALLQEQKDLLNCFITSFADDGLELRVYLNEELSRIKKAVKAAQKTDRSSLIVEKMTEVFDYLESLRRRDFKDEDLHKILKTQKLIKELATND